MANKNPMCDGAHCGAAQGEVRVYPLGAGGNLILCRECFAAENRYRATRGGPPNFPNIEWDSAEKYPEPDPAGWDAVIEIDGDPTNRCTVGELFRVDEGIDPSERAEIVAALRDHGEYRGGGGASAEYVLRTIKAKP